MNENTKQMPDRFACRYCRKLIKGFPVRIKKAQTGNSCIPFPQVPDVRLIMFVDEASRLNLMRTQAASPLLMQMIRGDENKLVPIERSGGYVVCNHCRRITDGYGLEAIETFSIADGDLTEIQAGSACIVSMDVARELIIFKKARPVEFYFLEEKVFAI